jgi:hypothetical protein
MLSVLEIHIPENVILPTFIKQYNLFLRQKQHTVLSSKFRQMVNILREKRRNNYQRSAWIILFRII